MTEQKSYKICAKEREITGKKVKKLRKNGEIPAVIYGRGQKPQSLTLNSIEFSKIYGEAGSSSLIDLSISDKPAVKVLSHEPDLNPVTGASIHVDFYRVRMDEKIKTEIPLEFIGESEAVTQLDGSLVTNRDNVEVECLPADLIPNIEVDISTLKTFEDSICVKDLKVPTALEVITDAEEVVASVEEPRSEEELAELEESAADEEKEALEKMEEEAKAETVEGEEGEVTETPEGEVPAVPQAGEKKDK